MRLYHNLIFICFSLDIVIESYIGYWIQTSDNHELACGRSGVEGLECYLSQGDGKADKYNYTIQGSTITRDDNFRKKGNYSGNGLISWLDGDSWVKQGR